MATNKQLSTQLKQLLKLLKKENKALKNNDGKQIEQLVQQKEMLIEGLQLVTRELTETEMTIAFEVKKLQDDNLLLTRQAISFNDNFLKLVGESVQKSNTTYSKKGNLAIKGDVGFINHSI